MDERAFQLEDLNIGQSSRDPQPTNNTREMLASNESTPRQEFSLPPVDGGKDAWLFLAGCFMIEALVWG